MLAVEASPVCARKSGNGPPHDFDELVLGDPGEAAQEPEKAESGRREGTRGRRCGSRRRKPGVFSDAEGGTAEAEASRESKGGNDPVMLTSADGINVAGTMNNEEVPGRP